MNATSHVTVCLPRPSMILLSMPGSPKEITVSKISEIKMPKTNRFLVRKICNNVSLNIFFFIVASPCYYPVDKFLFFKQ